MRGHSRLAQPELPTSTTRGPEVGPSTGSGVSAAAASGESGINQVTREVGEAPGPGVALFCIERGAFGGGLVPVVPAFRVHRIRHFSTDENGSGELPPGTDEIGFHAGLAGDSAVNENEAMRVGPLAWRRR